MMTSCCHELCRRWRMLSFAMSMLLFAGCAIQPGQQGEVDVEEEVPKARDEVIVVEAEVQKNFDAATSLMKQGEYESAIAILEKLVEAEQRLTAPYINLAIAYRHTGDDKKAQSSLDKALAIDKYDAMANNEQGLLLRKQGKFEEAKKAYTTALRKNPEYLPVIRNLGILCDIYLRDWECALEQFEKHQALSPDDKLKIWIADLKRRTGG